LNRRPVLTAHIAAIVGSVLVGAAVVATRSIVDDIQPFGLGFLRYLQGAIVLFVVLAMRRPESIRLGRSDLRTFAGLGILMYAIFPVLFNTSLQFTTASRGAVLLATMPLWSALLARRYGGERLRSGQALGVIISVTGVAVVFAESGLGFSGGRDAALGNLLMLSAAFVAGVYGVRIKPVLAEHAALKVTAYAMAIGAVLLAVPALIEGLPSAMADASVQTLLLVIYLGVAGGALAFWLFSVALTYLAPTQAIVYVNLNPVVATLLASIVLDEPLTISFALGFALVVAGLLLTNLPNRRARKNALVSRSG